ncbi:MAG: YkgJ family cysteine cluster protein [Deltaproteobacteria bacterium]|nr:YkgJ family cysteine cluster protein [Deltaproteobacteria bacterium]
MRKSPPSSPPTYDCMTCGACCCNSRENIAEGYRDYVQVTRRDSLLRDKSQIKSLAVVNRAGEIHLRLVGEEQRCVALSGTLGASVSCDIYALRPTGCRKVEAGDSYCRQVRRERGIDRTRPVKSQLE